MHVLPELRLPKFRLPKWLNMPTIGLDISDRTFKYVELSTKNGVRRIERFGTGDIPQGIITSGEISDVKKLGEALTKKLGTPGRMLHAAIALPEEKGFTRAVTMPRMSTGDLRRALSLQLEEHIPLSAAEAVFDFSTLETSNKDVVNTVFVAFPRTLVASYVAAIEEAGMHPSLAEPESQALARVVIPKSETGSVMIVDIGLTRASIFIAYEHLVRFTSTIAVSGQTFSGALMQRLQMDAVTAEKTKREYILGSGDDDRVEHVLAPIVDTLIAEMQKRLTYWEEQDDADTKALHLPPVSRIYLTGGESHMPGLPEYVSHQLKMDVTRARPWENVFNTDEYIPPISSHDMLLYGTALGLAFA